MSDETAAYLPGATAAKKAHDKALIERMRRADTALDTAEILVTGGCGISAVQYVRAAKQLLGEGLLVEDERRCRRIEDTAALRF